MPGVTRGAGGEGIGPAGNRGVMVARMSADVSEPVVVDNPEASRYELRLGDEVAGWSEYRPAGRSLIVAHTEIIPRYEGRGLGSVLVGGALTQIQARELTVIPTCPFTSAYIRRHPEWAQLVDASLRPQFVSGR